jgi:hypothetical protein
MERRRDTNNPLAGFLLIVTAGGLIFSDQRVILDRRLTLSERAAQPLVAFTILATIIAGVVLYLFKGG